MLLVFRFAEQSLEESKGGGTGNFPVLLVFSAEADHYFVRNAAGEAFDDKSELLVFDGVDLEAVFAESAGEEFGEVSAWDFIFDVFFEICLEADAGFDFLGFHRHSVRTL